MFTLNLYNHPASQLSQLINFRHFYRIIFFVNGFIYTFMNGELENSLDALLLLLLIFKLDHCKQFFFQKQ